MSILSSFRAALRRVQGTLDTGAAADDDMRAELDAHLEMATAENIRRGMTPDEARRRALLDSGGLTVASEAVRDQRGLPWLESIVADVKYASRTLRHAPAFTAIVIITLGLGIGANTAIFSVVRGVLLKGLPHRDADRLVYLRQSTDKPDGDNIAFSVPEVHDLRSGAPALGTLAEYSPMTYTLEGENSVRVNVGLVTGNFFETMGLSPILGRMTRPSDDGPGVPPVMVLTEQFWRQHFGADPNVVGTMVKLDGQSVPIIGVVQAAPWFPDRVDGFLNMVVSPHHLSAQMIQGRTHRMTQIVARLTPGATLHDARAQVSSVYTRMQRDHHDAYDSTSHYRVSVVPFKEALGERARFTLWLLMAAAAFVLIISAANVVNLTLMRGVRREAELVVRAALGAGVGRLRRLLLVENLMLTVMGAILGLALAFGGVKLLVGLAARYSPRAGEIGVDYVVLGFALGLSLLLALLLSFVAFVPREGTLASIVNAGFRRMAGSLSRQRVQRVLVVAQVAVSVVLLAGAGLLMRTMVELSDVSTGLQSEQMLTFSLTLMKFVAPGGTTDNMSFFRSILAADVHVKQQYNQMEQEIRALPGVLDVGLGSQAPLRASDQWLIKFEGKSTAVGEALPSADMRSADPSYFRASGIPLLQGREFNDTDRAGSGRVVIVNRTFVEQYFPNESPLGKRIALTGEVLQFTPLSGDWRTIVGVVGNTQDGGMDQPHRAAMFFPRSQELSFGGSFVIRANGDPSLLEPAVTRIVHSIAPTGAIQNLMTVAQIKDQSIAPRRLNAELIASLGALAVIIATVGIAGVLAFSVSTRTQEIGIRMSLGADRARVERMILWEGGVLLGIGLVLGVAGAYFGTLVLRGLLFGVAPHDPATFIAVALGMAAIGLSACWIPALRAARVDPAVAMRGG
ncbi:MAG TPA: ABC transporter permease [Gemmatimonadaceae bacterium]|jgi:predicted permease